jgi:hypothetical protein
LELHRLPPGDGGRAQEVRVDGRANFVHEFSDESRMLFQTPEESKY